MNFFLLTALILFSINTAEASNPCDDLVDIVAENHSNIKLYNVKKLMNDCLIQSQDYDYIDSVSDANINPSGSVRLNKNISKNMSCHDKKIKNFTINPEIKSGTIKIREKTSTQDLTMFMKDRGQNFDTAFQKFHTQGLMYSNLAFKIQPELINISSIIPPNKMEFCQYISNINYSVGYDDMLVYISKDTKKQSCEYYFTLRHELVHTAISRQVLMEYIPIIEKQINDAFINSSVYYQVVSIMSNTPDLQGFITIISDKINNEILLPIQNKMSEEMKIRNNQFDYEEFKYRQERLNYFCSE